MGTVIAQEELVKFLAKAHKEAAYGVFLKGIIYDNTVKKTFKLDNWIFENEHLNGNPMCGEERVFYDGMMIWAMSYRVHYFTGSESGEKLVRFCLRKAMTKMDENCPLRGPEEYVTDDHLYRYENTYDGTISDFTGEEKVFIGRQIGNKNEIYFMKYIGGLVLPR